MSAETCFEENTFEVAEGPMVEEYLDERSPAFDDEREADKHFMSSG